MAIKYVRLGGLSLGIVASPANVAVSFSYHGDIWHKFVAFVKRKRLKKQTANAKMTSSVELVSPAEQLEEPEFLTLVNKLDWYHTFDFGNGIKTQGQFDHGPILDRYNLPENLSGKRVLDVATFDGFWAFEFEKRGAKEVVGLDVKGPADCDFLPKRKAAATEEELAVIFGEGFKIAKQQLNSKVERVICNIYDLSPDKFGTFDVVHAGDFLVHLNSPVKALQNIAAVCTEYALISEVYFPDLDIMGKRRLAEYFGGHDDVVWWKMSLSALENMILDAGFSQVELIADFKYGQRGLPETMNHAVFKAYK